MSKPMQILFLFICFFLFYPETSRSQGTLLPDSVYFERNYVKQQARIPMRDGVKLFTNIYYPKDNAKKHPILLTRTPYSVNPYEPDQYPKFFNNLTAHYIRKGYILVYQDVRGRFMSEGDFVDVRPYLPFKKSKKDIDETTDTYDTVDWLIKNIPNNNGNVGIKGVSYPGFYTSMGTIDAHPAVKATSPQAPVSQWMGGDDWFHNGGFLLSHAFNFYVGFGWPRSKPNTKDYRDFSPGTPDGYKFFLDLGSLPNSVTFMKDSVQFWKDLMKHGSAWDNFWAERDILPHLKNLKPATMVVGGWFDTENLYGALRTYESIEKQNPGKFNTLVMGPWYHGQWSGTAGDSLAFIHWGSKTNYYYRDSLEVPFFNHFLMDEGNPKLSDATVFDTGAKQWKQFPNWPPKNTDVKNLYLQENNKLSFVSPLKAKVDFDEYIHNPDKPVPYTAEVGDWYNPAFMLEDQRFAEKRPDVLSYQSDRLTEGITIAGPIHVTLYGSTSGTDCDWIIKLIDVFPDTLKTPKYYPKYIKLGGYEMMVRGDVLRGKFRNGRANPEAFIPNRVTQMEFILQDAFHTFKKGHRMMVQVQSSWFPMIDRNPGKFVDIFQARESDFQKTVQRVYRVEKYPTHLTVHVLK